MPRHIAYFKGTKSNYPYAILGSSQFYNDKEETDCWFLTTEDGLIKSESIYTDYYSIARAELTIKPTQTPTRILTAFDLSKISVGVKGLNTASKPVEKITLKKMEEAGNGGKPAGETEGGSGSVVWIVVILLLLAAAGGAAYFFLFMKKKDGESNGEYATANEETSEEESNSVAITESANNDEPSIIL